MSKQDIRLVINSQLEKLSGMASSYYYLVEKQIGEGRGARYESCGEIDAEPGVDVYQEIEDKAAEEWGFGKFRLSLYDADGKRIPESVALRVNIRGTEISNTENPGNNPFHNAAAYDPTVPTTPSLPEEEEEEDPVEEDERYYESEVRLNRSKLAALREKKRYEAELAALEGGGVRKNEESNWMSMLLQMQMNNQKLEAERRDASEKRMLEIMSAMKKEEGLGLDMVVKLAPFFAEYLKPKDPLDSPIVKLLMDKAMAPPPPTKDPVAEIMPGVISSVTQMYSGLTERMIENMLKTKSEEEKARDQDLAMQRFREVGSMIKQIAPVVGGTIKDIIVARRSTVSPQEKHSSPVDTEKRHVREFTPEEILQDFITQYENGVEKAEIFASLIGKYPHSQLNQIATDKNVIKYASQAGDDVLDLINTIAEVTGGSSVEAGN